jgi:hypothetical protein
MRRCSWYNRKEKSTLFLPLHHPTFAIVIDRAYKRLKHRRPIYNRSSSRFLSPTTPRINAHEVYRIICKRVQRICTVLRSHLLQRRFYCYVQTHVSHDIDIRFFPIYSTLLLHAVYYDVKNLNLKFQFLKITFLICFPKGNDVTHR